MIDRKLLVCALASVVAHFALARGLEHLPPRVDRKLPQRVTVKIEPPPQPPPEPEKPPEPTPKPPEPTPTPHEAPRAHPQHVAVAPVPKDTPPPEHPAVTTDTTDTPVFGVTMESTSTGGTGPALPVGNTTAPAAQVGSAAPVKPLAQPVAAFEATKMPVMDERCRFGLGKYTDEALAAGVEGQVVIDLVVGEDGRVTELKVVQSLPHGLTEEAVTALRQCKFAPGEKDGKPVPVKIRGFKVTFVLPNNQ